MKKDSAKSARREIELAFSLPSIGSSRADTKEEGGPDGGFL
jgi:hypothetical protein